MSRVPAREIVRILKRDMGSTQAAFEYAMKIANARGPLSADYLEAAAILSREIWQQDNKKR